MKSKKAQIGMEFIIILSAIFLFISIFFLAIENNTEDKLYLRESILVKEIALTVQNEINLATNSIDGYSRNFKLPEKAGNLEYEINASEGFVYIRTKNEKHAMSFPSYEVNGEVNIGENKIEKINGVVYLNQWKKLKSGDST